MEDVQDLRDLEMPEERQEREEPAEGKGDEPHGEKQFDSHGHLITGWLNVGG